MTKEQFLKPYLLLVFQPWGRRYDLSTLEGQTQSELYYQAVNRCDVALWQLTCQQFAFGDHWPNVDELRDAYRAHSTVKDQPALPAPLEHIGHDFLPKLLFSYSTREGIPMAEATRKLIPAWLDENPTHADYALAKQLLADAESASQPKVRPDYCTAAQAKREPFVCGPEAEGVKGYCRRCETAKEILVCWCQRYEACRECLSNHVQTCPKAAVVTHKL